MASHVHTQRRLPKRGLALLAAILLSGLLMSTPIAQADDHIGGGTAGTRNSETAAWRPQIEPFYVSGDAPREVVFRNLSGPNRRHLLDTCPSGWVCVAAGEGDGEHSVFRLWYCPQRSLSYFNDAGAVNNNQMSGALVSLFYESGSLYTIIQPNNVTHSVDWGPIWWLDPC